MIFWILQTGESLHCDPGAVRGMRAMNLADKLVDSGHEVVIWSSAFYHQEKTHRTRKYKKIKISEKLEIRLIPSSGYDSNVSISRLYDHSILALNLFKQLKTVDEIPDIAFVGYPPIEAAYIMSAWLKKKKVPFLIDIKDQWPNILVESIPHPLKIFAKIFLAPYYLLAKKAMSNATAISAHSLGFLNWSLSFSNRKGNSQDRVTPLTVSENQIPEEEIKEALRWWADQGIEKKTGFRIIFVGSFSRAFDFDPIFKTAKLINSKQIDCEFILCGKGEKDKELRSKAEDHENVRIFSWIDLPKIRALSGISDASIAPYKSTDDFVISIPNKIIDSLMLGLPILSSLRGEVANLISNYDVGFTYSNSADLFDYIISLSSDSELQKLTSHNAKNLYELEFKFDNVYDSLVSHLENIRRI